MLYSLGEHRSSTDYRNFNNEIIAGEGWFWRETQRGNSVSDTFSTPRLSPVSQNCFLKVSAYPNSFTDSIFNEHMLIVRVNGSVIDTLKSNDYNRTDTTILFSSSLLSNSSVNQISVTYTGAGTYPGRMFFDYFSLQFPSNFTLQNNSTSFKSGSADSASRIFKINGFNPSTDINIYDVRNYIRIISNTAVSDTLLFTGKGNGNFEIANKYITHKPLRIKQKQVPNLASGSNGADYLLVYNKQFESQAEQLRQYRNSHDGFRSIKAEIEDIYDIFNYGMENPIAVRNFVQFVYNNWQMPKVKYLMLFGRGSLDPKKNMTGSQYYQNFIPVYGNPPTDGYFGNIKPSTFTYYQQISTGRLPAYTAQEAQDMVNKIIGYEQQSAQLESWVKRFIFITGGQNRQEQIQFANQSNAFINSYIYPPPVSGEEIKIYRNDSSGYVTYNYQDSIKKAINRGSLITNYIGHAASNTWDNGLDDPNVLTNQSRLPLVLSMTCFTGKNSETNNRSFGENFMFLPNKGALGFIGSTGWSFSMSGNTFNGYLLQGFAQDSLRRIGDIIRHASIQMSPDSLSFAARNTINCYNLLGDPASKLLMPVFPEFDIQQNDYALSNPFPSTRENITLKIYPKNLGTHADSCKIRYQLYKNNASYKIKDTVVYNFRFIDTVNYTFMIDSAGNYVMKVTLDIENWYPQELKTNNSISIPILLKNISFVPLKPIDNQCLTNDTVEFTGINPNIDPTIYNVKLLLRIDTTRIFNSPLCQTYFTSNISGVVTKFKAPVPILDSNIVYFWQMNAVINNTDTTGWSEVRRYSVRNNISDNSAENFRKSLFINNFSDSNCSVKKINFNQYSAGELNNISAGNGGLSINRFTGNILAQSWGGNFYDASFFILNQKQFMLIDSAFWGGLNVIKLSKFSGKLLEIKHFRFTTNQANDSLLTYLNSFSDNNIIIILKAIPSLTNFGLNSSVKARIKYFGSNYVDSVNLQSYSRWSFISYNSNPLPIVSESFINQFQSSPAISEMNPQFFYDSAFVISTFGPSKKHLSLNWDQIIFPNSFSKTDIYGLNRNNQEVLLFPGLQNNSIINLDTISS
ncbi:MAG: C25 family cysteine peptidase, partial [Ignavibacteriae bacterium]|nr:C25 family cysteine peptidase [Ignavibacteriota bacterium]